MENTKNSISTLLTQFLETYNNTLSSFDALTRAISTDEETVSLTLDVDDLGVREVTLPTLGYIKSEIDRLTTNVESLSASNGSSSSIQLEDGTYRKLIKSEIPSPANPVTALDNISTFSIKSNSFFEDFLNPLLTIDLDLTNKIDSSIENILVHRIVLDSNIPTAAALFDAQFLNKNELDYNNVINVLNENNIKYTVDSDTRSLPAKSSKFTGDFDVIEVNRDIITLSSLSYSRTDIEIKETEILRIGDDLLVNSGTRSTRYKVNSVDVDNKQIQVKLIEGFEGILPGANKLSIYRETENNSVLSIPVGFDERQIVFVRPIDSNSGILSREWSPGIGIYTNDLTVVLDDGAEVNLGDYYRNEVADFGTFLKSFKFDNNPTTLVGITPDAPLISENNFKVSQINTHLTDNESSRNLDQVIKTRKSLKSEISELDKNIEVTQNKLASKNYQSDIERNLDTKQLESLRSSRTEKINALSSILQEAVNVIDSSSLDKITPKYRVVGFWDIPTPKSSEFSKPQEVVQFEVQYRYLNKSGDSSNIIPVNISSGDSTKVAVKSNWNSILTTPRQKVKLEDGSYVYVEESIEDGNQINTNQLEIPIQAGEAIDVRIKSISEAGYPSNPLKSDFSEIVRIEFPDELEAETSITSLKEQTLAELQRKELLDELSALGVHRHIRDSVTVDNNYYAHDSSNIASGFKTPENKPIDLYTKLVELTQEVNRLRAIVEEIDGVLVLKLIDPLGRVYIVEDGQTLDIFAGYYEQEAEGKGEIISKTFFIDIGNSTDGILNIQTKFGGNKLSLLPDSTTSLDDYYRDLGMYDKVPISFVNSENTQLDHINEVEYQSSQLKGQALYLRHQNIDGLEEFYTDPKLLGNDNLPEYNVSQVNSLNHGVPEVDWLWSGEYSSGLPVPELPGVTYNDMLNNLDYNNSLYLHIDHPVLNDGLETSQTDIINSYTITHSKLAHIKALDEHGTKSAEYEFNSTLGRTIKSSFEPNDKYLLGGLSCGSYLFINPSTEDSINVGNSGLNATLDINGKSSSVQVPITYQYRMTDYSGPNNQTSGYIAGDYTGSTNDLTYSKRCGVDIKVDDRIFQFDLRFYSKYKSTGINVENSGIDITSALSNNPNPNV